MDTHSTFVILLAGDLEIDDRVRALCEDAYIIAADGGIKHAYHLGIAPDVWLGDFDSTPHLMHKHFNDVEKLTFVREKDATDGSLAIEFAVNKQATRIILLGAIGGDRFDHTLGLMFEMVSLHRKGIDIFMTSGLEECWPISEGQFSFTQPQDSMFSILPLTDIKGLTISGAAYPLDAIDVDFGSTLTLSNVIKGELQIDLLSGQAVLIARPHDTTGA
tara:strand:+ start:743 stop:1396 length:654 start_codon:yes stop_codon:yes gene_type:complete